MTKHDVENQFEVSLNGMFSLQYKDAPGTSNKGYHIHRHYELLLCLSDDMFLNLGEQRNFSISANTLLLFNNMDLHYFGTRHPGGENKRYVMYFEPSYIGYLSTAHVNLLECFLFRPFENSQILKLTAKQSLDLQKRFDEILYIQNQSDEECYGKELHLQLMVAELLLTVNTQYHQFYHLNTAPSVRNRKVVYDTIEYINHNYEDEISLDFLSKKFFVNKYSLCEMFRNVVGSTPNQYLINCRIMKAKELLIAGETVDSVCGKAGFGSLSHFSRIFKEKVGQSPKQYQLSMNNFARLK